MSVEVRHDKDQGTYDIGAEIDGTFISFASIPDSAVAGRIESAKAAEAQATPTGQNSPADDYRAEDFTDSGDGTYTRNTDGVRGTFGPSGFVEQPAP